MSKKVLIILAVGIIIIVAAFFIHKFEVEKVLDEAELEPVTPRAKKKTTPVTPVTNVTPGNDETDKVSGDGQGG